MHELIARLRQLDVEGGLRLPCPRRGQTARRHEALYDFGHVDLSLARLAEGHADALAILEEANRPGIDRALYGVWASDGPGSRLELRADSDKSLRLEGQKRFCTGAGLLDRGLVTVHSATGLQLIDVALSSEGISIENSNWASPAFAETNTSTVTFDGVRLSPEALVRAEGWYLSRAGFWCGALGPAACWAGGAAGLLDAAQSLNLTSPHARAQLGGLMANVWGMKAVLRQAGEQIDECSAAPDEIRRIALSARHLIERLCTDALDRFGRATGPRLLAFDGEVGRRYAELTLYIRQCHAEKDLELLAS